ncbi:2-oxoisovalerate dehydrogenase E1 component beta subunit [Thermosporothrix hazakensis]|jgi:2-oxoisovalerate dehydrogenase E1 component beta subunit|uniref:2-oxoisovalerate dehydrogenase E1 component beta subunit n=2 Tax=Thermosporothrix TaxID=768650 RepID=A0A326UQK3_THEHA|nr:alpha-ketoacid dehydrogenase subunit beta [Thermosporothrix hazakensis]PZW36329.1 2-oxoisovalerate dehydrogenase E1 component beta subunit [Thermosporothrix hazakensis]BBH88795.1 2-oxoisovalerate dehydrogenase subunit beta [Thermosporothrix sp. COM3]GCE46978.1 2-oxoisovalerate dehydrogenase subunit beta [Thermosporothrix hazakensis]
MSAKVTYLEAISQAIREEMRRDEAVFLLGEDVGTYGGAFKVSAGLLEEFGSERVIDTPMAEAAIIGSAVGAALMGMRPIAEMQYIDFITCGFDQIINMAAKMYWRVGMPVPIVVRGPAGGGTKGGPFHSSTPEAWFFHAPGIKVVYPSTAYDAKGLLKAAIRDNNPVLYLEHKLLYRMPELREELPEEDYVVPIGKAIVRREGEDMTMITYGAMVHQCLQAAQVLEREDDLEVEVLDLRSLTPLDREAISASVKHTNKVLIVHEDALTGGVGAELSALIAEDLFEYLDGPITRVAAPDAPFPYAPALEAAYLPNAAKILSAARELAAY